MYILGSVTLCLIPSVFLLLWYLSLDEGRFDLPFWFLALIAVLISVFLFFSILTSQKLKQHQFAQNKISKDLVKTIAAELGYSVFKNNQNYALLRYFPSSFWTSKTIQVVILYTGDEVLVNCTSFIRGAVSPFHWFSNRIREQAIIDVISKQLMSSIPGVASSR